MDSTATRNAPAGDVAGRSARLPLLDVLRGVAILGTLATNVWLFASPRGEASVLVGSGAMSPLANVLADPSPAVLLEGLFRTAANGKFLSLLTLLFGVGLAIQFRSAARRGQRWPGPYKWRALFLFFEGTVHFVLVFAWDVLMGYAVTALFVAWLLTRSERAQRVMMWTQAALHVTLMSLLTAGLVLAGGAAAGGGAPSGDGALVRLYAEGGYLEQVAFRLQNALVLRLEPIITFPMLVALFLLGVRLFRAGAFGDNATGRGIRARLMAWGLAVGVPLNAGTALAGPAFALVDRYVAAPVVMLGLLGLISWLVDRVRRPGVVLTAFSSLGRSAMSGYVLQNVVCALLCYGFGLGLAARLAGTGPWWVFGLWAAVSLAMLVGSTLWLRRFAHGPLEAVQRWTLARVPGGGRG